MVVSNAVRNYVRANYPFVCEDRLHVIHRGIETLEFPRGYCPDGEWTSEFARQFPKAAHQPLLTIAGRLTRLKGHVDFIRLMASLRDQDIAGHGLIVGGVDSRKTAYLKELKDLVTQLKLEDRITFTGHRTDLREIYAVSAMVLSLSLKPEAFGLTVAEALSIGTPVVGYDHGGVAEILAAQFPEGAVEPRNMRVLTQTVAAILSAKPRPVPEPNQYERSVMLKKTLELYSAVAESRESREHPSMR